MLLSTLFESFELGERDVPRELVDALAFMTPEEEQALLQFVAIFWQRFQDDDAGPSPTLANVICSHPPTQSLRQ